MRFAQRIEKLTPYLFVEISRKINEKRARGEDVISLAIGDPDLRTPDPVIKALQESLKDTANHRYPESDGLPEFRQAVVRWYKKRFNVEFDADTEVLPTIGSKEGIAHIAWCYIDPGDVALVPDPLSPGTDAAHHPPLAALQAAAGRREVRPQRLTARQADQHVGFEAVCHDDGGA